MKKISLPSGIFVPVLGQGTWKMGEDERDAKKEADALRLGIDLGRVHNTFAVQAGGVERVQWMKNDFCT